MSKTRYLVRPIWNKSDYEAALARSRVYEILNRKRPLSLAMVRRLHAGLGIEAEILIRAPAEAKR